MSSGLGSVSTEEAEQVYLEYSQIQTQTPYNSNLAGKKTSEPSTPNQQSGGLLLRSPESVLARKSAYFEQKNGSSEILGPQNTILRENLGNIQLERNLDSVDIFKLEGERNSLSGEFPAQEETSVKSNHTQKSTVEITCQQPANQDAESNIFKNKYSASFLEIYLQSHSKGSILDRFISQPSSNQAKNLQSHQSKQESTCLGELVGPDVSKTNRKIRKLSTEFSDSPNQLIQSRTCTKLANQHQTCAGTEEFVGINSDRFFSETLVAKSIMAPSNSQPESSGIASAKIQPPNLVIFKPTPQNSTVESQHGNVQSQISEIEFRTKQAEIWQSQKLDPSTKLAVSTVFYDDFLRPENVGLDRITTVGVRSEVITVSELEREEISSRPIGSTVFQPARAELNPILQSRVSEAEYDTVGRKKIAVGKSFWARTLVKTPAQVCRPDQLIPVFYSKLQTTTRSKKSSFLSTSKRLELRSEKGAEHLQVQSEVSFTEQNHVLNLVLRHRSIAQKNACLPRVTTEVIQEGRISSLLLENVQSSKLAESYDVRGDFFTKAQIDSSIPVNDLMLPFNLEPVNQPKATQEAKACEIPDDLRLIQGKSDQLTEKSKVLKKCSVNRRILGAIIPSETQSGLNLLQQHDNLLESPSLSPSKPDLESKVLRNYRQHWELQRKPTTPHSPKKNLENAQVISRNNSIHCDKQELIKENLSPFKLVRTSKKTSFNQSTKLADKTVLQSPEQMSYRKFYNSKRSPLKQRHG